MVREDELVTMCAVAAGCYAMSELHAWRHALTSLKRSGMGSCTSWWDQHSANLSAYDIHSRWGVWPSSISKLLELAGVLDESKAACATWNDICGLESTKHVCHALEYLVHST